MRFSCFTFFCLAFVITGFNAVRADDTPPTTNLPFGFTPGTLAHHLSTNAAARARGRAGNYDDLHEVTNWFYGNYSPKTPFPSNVAWSTNFWLHGVHGLSATSLGTQHGMGGQGLLTMISPRHYLIAGHINGAGLGNDPAAFLDTNNVFVWAKPLDLIYLTNDISVGVMKTDLPAAVGFLPLLPANFADYLPTNTTTYFQGLGMNQDLNVFSQSMVFFQSYHPLDSVHWPFFQMPMHPAPLGVGTNWTVFLRGGDSSAPARLLVDDQLVLISHNFGVGLGPNYAHFTDLINQTMHRLSVKNHLPSDYQITPVSLTNFTTLKPQ